MVVVVVVVEGQELEASKERLDSWRVVGFKAGSTPLLSSFSSIRLKAEFVVVEP